MSSKKKKLIAVVGPTASGKTALAVKLAQHYDGEVISADSMQIYKGMTIATAKPTTDEMQGIPHHLIDFLKPSENFSVSEYVKLANKATEDILSRGKLPILCGGTGLYVRSFLENVQFSDEESDFALREELTARYKTEGGEKLIEEIRTFDPETAEKLLPSNSKRIIRAIEIYRLTGVTMSESVKRSKSVPLPYDFTAIGITYADRQKLYDRINQRVDQMIENGLLEVDGKIDETLPDYILNSYNVCELNTAIHQIHFPNSFDDFELARKRLVFEELLSMQLALLALKNQYSKDVKGIKLDKNVRMSDVINALPFSLTKAQLRVLEEIDSDMEADKPMNRLLQGDVGSGKTVVAEIAAYKCVKCGYQAAIMAPTAILARQHLESFTELLGQFGIKCELLVSGITKKKKE